MGVYPFSSPLSAMEGEKAHKPPPRKKRKLNPKEEKKSYLDELPEEIVVCYIFPFVEHEAVKKGKLPPLVFVSKKFYLLFYNQCQAQQEIKLSFSFALSSADNPPQEFTCTEETGFGNLKKVYIFASSQEKKIEFFTRDSLCEDEKIYPTLCIPDSEERKATKSFLTLGKKDFPLKISYRLESEKGIAKPLGNIQQAVLCYSSTYSNKECYPRLTYFLTSEQECGTVEWSDLSKGKWTVAEKSKLPNIEFVFVLGDQEDTLLPRLYRYQEEDENGDEESTLIFSQKRKGL